MLKYVPELTDVVMEEIPGKVTLAVEISNCPGNCPGCHSPFLRSDIGEELTPDVIDKLLKSNFGVNCFLFLGEGNDPKTLYSLTEHIRNVRPDVEIAVYSGRSAVEDRMFDAFDYVKVGPYIEKLGPLNNPATNQRLYHHRKDITSEFWRKGKSVTPVP